MKFHKPIHGPAGKEAEFITAAFEKYAPGKIEYVTPDWSTWYSELLAAKPDEYDIIYVPGGWIPALARKGLLEDLGFIGARLVDRWRETVPKAAFEAGIYNNIQYGLPVYGAVWCFMYNRNMMQRAGYDRPPATWDELISCAKIIQQKQLARFAYGLNDDSDGHFIDHGYIYLMAGGLSKWRSKDGRVLAENDWPGKGLTFLQDMIGLGLCNVPLQSSSLQIRDQFFAGELAMTIGPSDWILHQRQIVPEFPLGVSFVPYPAEGRSTSCGSYGFYCMMKDGRGYEDRLALLEHLLKPDFLNRHLERIGMLPVHRTLPPQSGQFLSVFSKQLLQYSECFPAMDASFQHQLTSGILSSLRLEKTPEKALLCTRV